jgi:CheY-like chemotaxis protein
MNEAYGQRRAVMSTKHIQFILIDDDVDEHYLFEQDCKHHVPHVSLQCFDSWFKFLEYVGAQPSTYLSKTIVLLDLNMPDISGHQVIEKMRADGRFKTLPIVVYSTSKSQSDIQLSYALGANSFISKPADREEAKHLTVSLADYWAKCVELPLFQ